MHPLDEHLRFAQIGSSSDTNFVNIKNIERKNKQKFFFGGGNIGVDNREFRRHKRLYIIVKKFLAFMWIIKY
jgi:hypothetical protein